VSILYGVPGDGESVEIGKLPKSEEEEVQDGVVVFVVL
jgi:hypothetical protein